MAIQSDRQEQVVVIVSSGRSSTLTLTGDSLRIERPGESRWKDIRVPLYNVIWSEIMNGTLEVSVLAKSSKKASYSLVRLTTTVDETQKHTVVQFVDSLNKVSRRGDSQKPRRLRVLVNPNSGPGKAVPLFVKKVEPLLRAARCTLNVTYTTHRNHATEIARDLALDEYDAIVIMSGDGLVHEVLNGFTQHKNPLAALKTPIAPIPAGSGNGFSLNILGLEDGADVSAAALNAATGRPMSIDLFSLTQKGTTVYSFMTQCVGLMAELDLWTEHLRFMGSARFVWGYLSGIVKRRACPIRIQIKVAQSEKTEIYKTFREERSKAVEASLKPDSSPVDSSTDDSSTSGLPPLKYLSSSPEDDGWITVDKPTLYVYAGKGPFVSQDLMQFPVSLPNDGYIDVVVQERVSRGEMLSQMDGATEGAGFWSPHQQYFKAEAYRVSPLSTKSCLSVDGEEFPFEPYHIEVHKGLARVLSPYGYYNADFKEPTRS